MKYIAFIFFIINCTISWLLEQIDVTLWKVTAWVFKEYIRCDQKYRTLEEWLKEKGVL